MLTTTADPETKSPPEPTFPVTLTRLQAFGLILILRNQPSARLYDLPPLLQELSTSLEQHALSVSRSS